MSRIHTSSFDHLRSTWVEGGLNLWLLGKSFRGPWPGIKDKGVYAGASADAMIGLDEVMRE